MSAQAVVTGRLWVGLWQLRAQSGPSVEKAPLRSTRRLLCIAHGAPSACGPAWRGNRCGRVVAGTRGRALLGTHGRPHWHMARRAGRQFGHRWPQVQFRRRSLGLRPPTLSARACPLRSLQIRCVVAAWPATQGAMPRWGLPSSAGWTATPTASRRPPMEPLSMSCATQRRASVAATALRAAPASLTSQTGDRVRSARAGSPATVTQRSRASTWLATTSLVRGEHKGPSAGIADEHGSQRFVRNSERWRCSSPRSARTQSFATTSLRKSHGLWSSAVNRSPEVSASASATHRRSSPRSSARASP